MFKIKVKRSNYLIRKFPYKEFRLLQLSDLHLGYNFPQGALENLVDLVLSSNPDFVVITGDLIECDVLMILNELKYFKKLTSKIDTYFVFGNHDTQYNSPTVVLEILKSLGIRPLINESVWIGDDTSGFNLAGITDNIAIRHNYPKTYHPNIKKSLRGIRTDFPVILLSHRPIRRYMDDYPCIDMIISGHLHGGQIFPFGFLALWLKKNSREKLVFSTTLLDNYRYIHVSKGIGFTRIPFRFLAPPEINLIEFFPL